MPRAHSPPRGAWLLAVAGLFAVVWSLDVPAPPSVVPSRCDAIAEVAGNLVCDEALVVPDACGVVHVLQPGDSLDPARCSAPGRMEPDALAALDIPVDPNVDDARTLASLPGVGPVLARRIVQGRPYANAEALLAVKGIGPRTLARIRPRLRFVDPVPDRQPDPRP